MKIHTLENGEMVKKYHVGLLVNKGTKEVPSWIQIEKSTDNTITMNPETNDRDFIVDVSATTVLDRYKPSLSEPITLFKGNPDYDFFWNKFYTQATGDSATGQILVVFMNEEGTEPDTFKSWFADCTFICNNLNPVDSTLTFDINFNGTIQTGTVAVDEDGNPVFTKA